MTRLILLAEGDGFPKWAIPLFMNADPTGCNEEDVDDATAWEMQMCRIASRNGCYPSHFELSEANEGHFEPYPEFGKGAFCVHWKFWGSKL